MTHIPLETQRKDAMREIYLNLRFNNPNKTREQVFSLLAKEPAPSFYIKEIKSALALVGHLESGAPPHYTTLLAKKVADFYNVFRKLWRQNPQLKDAELIALAKEHEAPSFYCRCNDNYFQSIPF